MGTKIGIGFSDLTHPETAAKNAAFLSKTNLNDDKIDLAIIFSTVHYPPEKTIPVFQKILNTSNLIGTSSAGLILSDGIKTKGISVLTISSDEIELGIGSVNHLKDIDSFQAGSLLAKNALSNFTSPNRQAFLYFSDTKIHNHNSFLKGLQSVLGSAFPIIGAGSSDNYRFRQTFQLYQAECMTNAAVGVLWGGHISLETGIRHGWKPLGKPRFVDASNENIIKTIDGEKASNIYKEFLSQEFNNTVSFQQNSLILFYPLGIYMDGHREYLLKNPIGMLPDGSLISRDHVPVGSRIHLMIGNKDSCIQSARDVAHEVFARLNGKLPKFILVMESMTRLKLLGRSAFQEFRNIKEIFGSAIPIIGMYSNGEVCPYETTGRFKNPLLQNESILITAVT